MKFFKTIDIDSSGLDFIQFVFLIYKNILLLIIVVAVSSLVFYSLVSNYQNNSSRILKNSVVGIEVDCNISVELLNFIYNFKRISTEKTYSDFHKFFLSLENCELITELKSTLTNIDNIQRFNSNVKEVSSVYKNEIGILSNNIIKLNYKFRNEDMADLNDSDIQAEKNDIAKFANFYVNEANKRVSSKIIYYLDQVARFVQSDIDKINFTLSDENNFQEERGNLKLDLSGNLYIKKQLEDLKDLYVNTIIDENSVFIFFDDKVSHKIIEVDKDRLNLFHKIKASVLTLYFLLFSTLIFILLIVFINSLLNSRIINEK